MAQKPSKSNPNGCWGKFKRMVAFCEKKPRKGMLTCWWHRDQEAAAKILKVKLEEKRDGGRV